MIYFRIAYVLYTRAHSHEYAVTAHQLLFYSSQYLSMSELSLLFQYVCTHIFQTAVPFDARMFPYTRKNVIAVTNGIDLLVQMKNELAFCVYKFSFLS